MIPKELIPTETKSKANQKELFLHTHRLYRFATSSLLLLLYVLDPQ